MLARRAITSKDTAGCFALETDERRWHDLTDGPLRFRATGVDDGPLVDDPAADGHRGRIRRPPVSRLPSAA